MSCFVESLEGRQLMSANPIKATNPTVAADMQRITDDRLKIQQDALGARVQLAADRAAIPTVRSEDLAVLRNARLMLRADRGNPTAVLQDRANILDDQAKLKNDVATLQLKIRTDQATTRNLLIQDRTQLRNDQITLRRDEILARG